MRLKGLGHLEIPHFSAAYLLHDPSCNNDAINAEFPGNADYLADQEDYGCASFPI